MGLGFNIVPALQHYQCIHAVDAVTNHLLSSNTVKLLHGYLTQTTMYLSDRIFHALNFLSCAITNDPNAVHHKQLLAISNLRDLFSNWIPSTNLYPPTPDSVSSPPLPVTVLPVQGQPPLPPPQVDPLPRVVPLPRVNPPPRVDQFPRIAAYPTIAPTLAILPSPKCVPPATSQLVYHQTRSHLSLTAHTDACRKYPSDFINDWDFSVLDAVCVQ